MTQPAQNNGHEWKPSRVTDCCTCGWHCEPNSTYPECKKQWQAHAASVAQAAQPQEVPAPAYPKPCGLCESQIESAEDTEWHGLGNCVPICDLCTGSGTSKVSLLELAASFEKWGSPSGIEAGRLLRAVLESRVAAQPPAEELEAPRLVKLFHITYECLAPSFGYETRKESAVAWESVLENNRKLMTAVCEEVRTHQAARERELREKLEGLAALWYEQSQNYPLTNEAIAAQCAVRLCAKELRALLASHWPAQKEDAK